MLEYFVLNHKTTVCFIFAIAIMKYADRLKHKIHNGQVID